MSKLEEKRKQRYLDRIEEHERQELIDRSGFVYLIRCNEYFKIGKAIDVASRMHDLQSANPNKLQLIFSVKVPNPLAYEKQLHIRFANKKHRQEWFKLDIYDIKMLLEDMLQYYAKEE